MHHQQRRPEAQLKHEVAVGDAVNRIGRRPIKAEVGGERLAVEAERVAGEGARAERALVHALGDLRETLAVALPRRRVRKHPVRPANGLRRLKVRVAGHEDVRLGGGALRSDGHERAHLLAELRALVAQVQPQVGHHLVVARAAGVHLAANGADELGEPALVGGVDVLVAILLDECAGGPLGLHLC